MPEKEKEQRNDSDAGNFLEENAQTWSLPPSSRLSYNDAPNLHRHIGSTGLGAIMFAVDA